MKKKLLGILFFAMAIMVSCKNTNVDKASESATNQRIEKANWLIGTWQNNSQTEKTIEIWKKENDSTYLGKSYSLHNADTISSERIRLEEHGDKCFYIPVVKNQNKGEVVKFTLTSMDANQLVFENPEHDFPQKISYTLMTNDSLFAEISGTYKGQQESKRYPMHRVQ
jgi:hypothetical protein